MKLKLSFEWGRCEEYLLVKMLHMQGWEEYMSVLTHPMWRLLYSQMHVQLQDGT